MILENTSVLVDFSKENNNCETGHFRGILENEVPFGITSIIFQGVLQGAKSERAPTPLFC